MRLFLLFLGLSLTLPVAVRADEAADIADLADPDGAALRRYKVPVTPVGVLAVVKEATGADVPDADLSAAIADLTGGGKEARQQAVKKLTAWGPVAAPLLRVAAGSPNAEVNRQARTLLDLLSKSGTPPALPSAVRVLLRQKDAAIIEPLVKLLPFIQDPELEADLWYGLEKHVVRDPAIAKIIIDRFGDPMASRRALAGHFAARHGGEDGKTKAVALLDDPVPVVRLRAAQGLLAVRDARGVPALIGLLVSDDNEIRWQAEELLRCSAPAGCPTEPIGTVDLKQRTAIQAAWQAWWDKSGGRVDFTAADQTARRPILMLICDRTTGRIALIGSDGKPRAEWPALERLNDVRYLPGGDVVAVQGTGPVNTGESRLSVSRPGGPVVWENKDLENPASCQLLPDGRLFVPEHPRAGEEVFRYQILSLSGAFLERQSEWPTGGKTFVSSVMLPGGRLLAHRSPTLKVPYSGAFESPRIYEPANGIACCYKNITREDRTG